MVPNVTPKFHLKKVGEFQFSFRPPVIEENGDKLRYREGCIFIEAAKPLPGGDGDQMDFHKDRKVAFKLDARELSKIIVKARRGMFPIRVTHRTESAGTAVLTIAKGNPIANGEDAGLDTYRWEINRNRGDQRQDANIYLNDIDMHMLFNLFEGVQPAIFGWTDQGLTTQIRDSFRYTHTSITNEIQRTGSQIVDGVRAA